jgi:hypothetical protein
MGANLPLESDRRRRLCFPASAKSRDLLARRASTVTQPTSLRRAMLDAVRELLDRAEALAAPGRLARPGRARPRRRLAHGPARVLAGRDHGDLMPLHHVVSLQLTIDEAVASPAPLNRNRPCSTESRRARRLAPRHA